MRKCASVLFRTASRYICDNPHINPSMAQFTANSPGYHNKFVLMFSNIRYFKDVYKNKCLLIALFFVPLTILCHDDIGIVKIEFLLKNLIQCKNIIS